VPRPGRQARRHRLQAGRSAGHGIHPERIIAELAAGDLDAALVANELTDHYVIVASARPAAADSPARQPART
jgi:hypothetical protein